tara:strand:- start:40096 stop:40428 length:333 start_codon:yes stop_codon:yes gene_type:complete
MNKELFYSKLANNINQARIKSGLSQDEVSRLIGLSRASIINIEKGRQKVNLYLLCQFADIFKVDVSSLLPEQSSQTLNNAKLDKIVSIKSKKHVLNTDSVDILRSFAQSV